MKIYLDGVEIGVADEIPEVTEITAERIAPEGEEVPDYLGEDEIEIQVDPQLAKRLLMIMKKELGIIKTVRKNERLEF